MINGQYPHQEFLRKGEGIRSQTLKAPSGALTPRINFTIFVICPKYSPILSPICLNKRKGIRTVPKLKFALIISIVIIFTGLAVFALEQKMMSIQVKKGAVRSSPSFLGRIVAQLKYGDQVAVQGAKGSWYFIDRPKGRTDGWVHSSALSKKRIVLNPGASDVEQAASSDEITLAGKGFNQQVENDFKSKNPQVDFTWINKMEKMTVSQNQIQVFIKEGQLSPRGAK